MSAAAVVALFGCLHSAAVAQDYYNSGDDGHYYNQSDDGYRYAGGQRVVITGTVIRVNLETGRFAMRSDGNRRYSVDTYNAHIETPDATAQDSDDSGVVSVGSRVRVVGYRFGIGRVDADRVTVIADTDDAPSAVVAPAPVPIPAPVPVAPAPAPVDANPLPAVMPAAHYGDLVRMDAIINAISDAGQLTVTGADGQVYQVKTADADIIVPLVNRAGALSDLAQGMHIRVIGEHGDAGVLIADRIRILPNDDADVAAPAAPAPQITDLSSYTGIIIDVRDFPNIQRSPSPAIYGADMSLLYPDRSHVPNPDEVQDESIVRYYRSEDAAEAGVGGSHPLILTAQSIVGPAEDGVMLSADDAALFKALDQRLGYSHNWKVGFLIPADR